MLDKYGYIGERIRKERTKYDLSLSELAKEIGVSVSLLSLVENGKATPSMTVLDKICSFFSIHMASLFEEETGNPKVVLLKKDKQFEVKIDEARARRFLLPRTGVPIEPVLVTIDPGAPYIDFSVHKGVEYGYVLEGAITVEVEGGESVTCGEGRFHILQGISAPQAAEPVHREGGRPLDGSARCQRHRRAYGFFRGRQEGQAVIFSEVWQ